MTDTGYASALYSLTAETGTEALVLAQLGEIKKAVANNPDYLKLLCSPALSSAERIAAAEEAFSGCDLMLLNFIKLLTERRLMYILPKCADEFEREYNVAHGIERAVAETAVPLDGEMTERLQEKLEKITGKSIILENRVTPKLLGGMVIKLSGNEYDGSILKKLRDMEERMLKTVM